LYTSDGMHASEGHSLYRAGVSPRHRASPSETLEALAADVRRLAPDRRDPERFHVEKAEIEQKLRRLAREVEHHG